MGRPLIAFEESAGLFLSFLSFPADKKGAAKVSAARRNITANPVIIFLWRQGKLILQDLVLFMIPAPFTGIRTTRAEGGAGFCFHTFILTLGGVKSCRWKWSVAPKVRRCSVRDETPRRKRNSRRLSLSLQVSPTSGASGKDCRSRAERKAFRLQTSCASSWRRTK